MTTTKNNPGAKLLFQQTLLELERRGINISRANKLKPELVGPLTRDELWQAVYELTGYRIPRVAVCEGHTAPFEIFARVYFEEVSDALMIGNRGGGKTTLSGFLHGAKNRWRPGYKSCICGASQRQSDRAYEEFLRFTRFLSGEIVSTLQKKTTWTNASEAEVITGTIKSVNGPHPHFAQFDELELSTLDVFEEWLNMSQGDANYEGQNLLSSTRKKMYGLIQAIVKQCDEAKRRGEIPPWDVMFFCVFETMMNQPNCGVEDENGNLLCGCDKIVKGKWPLRDGETAQRPRTFASVCDGRGKRADGFVNLKDVHRRFQSLSQKVWEAQQECLRPSSEGLVHEWWDPQLYELPNWFPRPEYGPICRSWDWGGTHPHAVLFHQMLSVPVMLVDDNGEERLLQEGTIITFDEIFHPGGGFYGLGKEVFERTQLWAEYGFDFDVEWDFCDPSGASPKADVTRASTDFNFPAPRWRMHPQVVEESVEKHVEWGEDGILFVVGARCPNLIREYESYHWPEVKPGMPPPKNPVKFEDDAVDSMRYYIWNEYKLMYRYTGSGEMPTYDLDSTHPTQARGRELSRSAERSIVGDDQPKSILAPSYPFIEQPLQDRPMIRREQKFSVRSMG